MSPADPFLEYAKKRDEIAAALAALARERAPVRLDKATSNLFRHRSESRANRLDVRSFHSVLNIDRERMLADVEGMTTYEEFVDAALEYGLLPAVVPQLKSITVGGAVSGVGIESSSFRFGLVHETVNEMEILLAGGSTVVCSRDRNADLFFGFPNSYGTLGYALRLQMKLVPAKPYVHLKHTRFANPESYFRRIADTCSGRGIDYLDGTVFDLDEMYLTEAEFSDSAPFVSDYTYMRIYYKSIRHIAEDWLTANGYIWRWDTDWFWCSRHFCVQNPVVRLLATKWALNSRTYQRIMRLSHTVWPQSNGTESVIQDVDIPIENAVEFLRFLFADIGIRPVWICPFRAYDPEVTYDLYALDPNKVYINFGFWDMVPTTHEDGYYNKKVEGKALELNGKKGLYSTAYYDEETFWKIYNRPRYAELKKKYDPDGVFRDLYDKCVKRR